MSPLDPFSWYEQGLGTVKEVIEGEEALYLEFLVYESRLRESIARSRLYGDTEASRAERAEVIDRLNQFALAHLGTSFTSLSTPDAASMQQASPAPSSSGKTKLSVFLCHSSADKPAVRELYRRLNA